MSADSTRRPEAFGPGAARVPFGVDFLADRHAFLRRWVLAQILGPPKVFAGPRMPMLARKRSGAVRNGEK